MEPPVVLGKPDRHHTDGRGEKAQKGGADPAGVGGEFGGGRKRSFSVGVLGRTGGSEWKRRYSQLEKKKQGRF